MARTIHPWPTERRSTWSNGRPRPSTQLQSRKRPSGRTTIRKRSREATPEMSPAGQCGETLQGRSRVPFRGRHPTGEDARRSKKKGGSKAALIRQNQELLIREL